MEEKAELIRQNSIKKNSDEKDSKLKALHDHSRCVKALPNELKIDHDADLIEGEGNPLEEFNEPMYENLIDHSKCTLAWTEDWAEAEEIELSKSLLLGQGNVDSDRNTICRVSIIHM